LAGREPKWWYGARRHWQTTLLSPVASLVGTIATARLKRKNAYRSSLPVICVGNFTAGGSGKTPLALLIARLVAEQGRDAWFLSRGYGGRVPGPLRVDPAVHGSVDVGDEPLLLASHAPTVISRDRRKGAEAIEAAASKNAVIIMDDGLQNPALAKTLVIAVVAGDRGFGNGRVIPAGPLRAPISAQIGLVDVIVVARGTGPVDPRLQTFLSANSSASVIRAETRARLGAERFRGQRFVAFAGIAHPERFFATLESLGAVIVERQVFADHHAYNETEARRLIDTARRMNADLVTTEKDLARLSGAVGARGDLREHSTALAIETVIESDGLAILKEKIREVLAR
jgi:tetraacyldisaccharide 4'-kinase